MGKFVAAADIGEQEGTWDSFAAVEPSLHCDRVDVGVVVEEEYC